MTVRCQALCSSCQRMTHKHAACCLLLLHSIHAAHRTPHAADTPPPPSLCVCVSLRYAQTTRDCLARLCVLMELWRETLLARAAGEVVETGGPDALALDTCRLEGCMLFVLISTLDEGVRRDAVQVGSLGDYRSRPAPQVSNTSHWM